MIAIADQHHSQQFQIPRASIPVEVKNLLFNLCICIHAQVKVLAVQQSRNQTRDIYE